MPLMIILLVFAQNPSLPLEGFRGNMASTRAQASFRVRLGHSDAAMVSQLRKGPRALSPFEFRLHTALNGRWTYDGLSEYVFAEPSKRDPRDVDGVIELNSRTYCEPFELLQTNDFQAFHYLEDRTLQVMQADPAPGHLLTGHGPLSWWGTFKYPESIEILFPAVKPETTQGMVWGNPCDIVTYKSVGEGFWHRLDVFHDRNHGFVPRFVRLVSHTESNTFCKEVYTRVIEGCRSGGFVPIETYTSDFITKKPANGMDFLPVGTGELMPMIHVALGHTLLSDFSDKHDEGFLERGGDVSSLSALGERVGWRKGSKLTAKSIKSAIGSRLSIARPSKLPSIDVQELEDRVAKEVWSVKLVAVIVACVALFALAVFTGLRKLTNRRSAILPLLFAIVSSGCGQALDDQPRLAGRLEKAFVFVGQDHESVDMPLVVKNGSKLAITITDLDAGCSCR